MLAKGILGIAAILLIAGSTLANGLPGQRMEQVVGNKIVDVGTDQTTPPVAGSTVEFDFGLLDSSSRQPWSATNVGVAIERSGKTMVNGNLINDPSTTFLFYTFPEPGTYTLKVHFFDSRLEPMKQSLAYAEFPVRIGSQKSKRIEYIAGILGVFFAGLGAGFWGTRNRASH
jgi:hypothetical protein